MTFSSLGFSAKAVISRFEFTRITPRLEASERGMGFAAIVMSAPLAMCASTMSAKFIWYSWSPDRMR